MPSIHSNIWKRFKLHFLKKYIYIKKFSTFFTIIIIYQESLIKEIYINLMLSISLFPNLLIYFQIQVKFLIGSKLIRLYYTYTLIWESIARQKIRKIFKHYWISKKEQFCYTAKSLIGDISNSGHALNSSQKVKSQMWQSFLNYLPKAEVRPEGAAIQRFYCVILFHVFPS